jgi:hypothetical protein
MNGRLFWDRHAIENYKLALMGRSPVESNPSVPILLVTAKQLTAEFPVGCRQIGRFVKGRVQDAVDMAAASVGA